jgi:hypothetical protein
LSSACSLVSLPAGVLHTTAKKLPTSWSVVVDDLNGLLDDAENVGDAIATREAPEAAARQRNRDLIRSPHDDTFYRKPIEACPLNFPFKHGAMLARRSTLARDASKSNFGG